MARPHGYIEVTVHGLDELAALVERLERVAPATPTATAAIGALALVDAVLETQRDPLRLTRREWLQPWLQPWRLTRSRS
jgi:hypothetical protein